MRRRRLASSVVCGVAATVVSSSLSFGSGAPAGAATSGIAVASDKFSAVVSFRTPDGMFAAPIHGAVLPDGRMVLLGIEADSATPDENTKMHATWVQAPDARGATLPASVTINPLDVPTEWHDLKVDNYLADDSLVCGGLTFLGDGRLMLAGGPRSIRDATTGNLLIAAGVNYGVAFDGTSFQRVPGKMQERGGLIAGRWYPTLTRLADGRILVTGGFDLIAPLFSPNLSEEIFDPSTNTWQTLSTQQQSPWQTHDADYTAVFQLPTAAGGADVVMIGEDGVPIFLNTSVSAGWRVSANARPGATTGAAYSTGAGTAMLPIRLTDGEWGYHNGSFLTMSGQVNTTAMSHADIYDPVLDQWKPTIDTGVARHYPAPVLLPDGRVLLINGHDTGPSAGVLSPQYIDPGNGFAVTKSPATTTEIRGYHNVAMLLPDGRVLVAGGRDIDRTISSEKPDYAYFSPSYVAKTRPVIRSAPTALGYGQSAYIGTGAKLATDAVLISLPAMTHAFDQNQRSVQIKLTPVVSNTANDQISAITAPADAKIAPPGTYMLFVLDANRVPSTATMIHIG